MLSCPPLFQYDRFPPQVQHKNGLNGRPSDLMGVFDAQKGSEDSSSKTLNGDHRDLVNWIPCLWHRDSMKRSDAS
jgi:hypothetical protein